MSLSDLKRPFSPSEIEWRAGVTNADKTSALALAYISSRAVMDRLDEAVGPENWRDEYANGPQGGVLCGISIRCGDEWVTKWDGAENTDFEAVKGGLSDAFKRAGVKWGIGRYLYGLEGVWVKCEQRGKSIVLKEKPKLPSWALPEAAHEEKQERTQKGLVEYAAKKGISSSALLSALKQAGITSFSVENWDKMVQIVDGI